MGCRDGRSSATRNGAPENTGTNRLTGWNYQHQEQRRNKTVHEQVAGNVARADEGTNLSWAAAK